MTNTRKPLYNYDIAYKDDGCCIYSCSAFDCPETICFLDYPGYKKTIPIFKEALKLHLQGVPIEEISRRVNLKKKQLEEFFTKLSSLVLA